MTVSLLDAEGRPISAFGSHASWNQGAVTNAASFSETGAGSTSGSTGTGAAKISPTKAGSTKALGYQDLAAQSPGAPHQPPLEVAPAQITPPRTNPDEQPGSNPVGDALKAVAQHYGPTEQPGRNDEFQVGRTSSLPGAGEAAGIAEDLADVAEVA